ncbi:MAG: reverse transcriptase family protein [Betaproteobacteria bacterium]
MTRRSITLAVARALLAGPREGVALQERLRACLASESLWLGALARGAAALPVEWWSEASPDSVAAWVGAQTVFDAAWDAPQRLAVRGYFMSRATTMADAPVALRYVERPAWPSIGALAQGLDVSVPGLWRLTRSASWQRQASLGDQHYRYELCPKRTGGWRLLEVPQPYLRVLQRRVLDSLLAKVPPHEAACAYVRGRSVVDHALAHAGQAVLLKFDLQDFFTTVRASRVHATFVALGYSNAVARELMALCTTATPEPVLARLREQGGLTWTQAMRLRDAHLPQGAPTSAALANLCAFRLDVRVAGLARELGARYTRYADDIVLSGGDALRAAAARVEARIGAIALDEGFALNHRKTRRITAARRQQVCGVVVNTPRLNLQRDEFDRLKAILHRCVQHGPAAQNREGIAHWEQHLRGRVAWAAQLDPGEAARLRRDLDRIDWSR